MIFKEHVSKEQGLSDLLNYAHLVEDGIVLNKDGAFLVCYKFHGPDIHSATTGELDALSNNFNRMVTLLEDGWMLHVDELRIPSITYPEEGNFPDSVSKMIDEERRQLYESEGEHFENLQFLTFVWKFPLPIVKTARHWFVEGTEHLDKNDQNLWTLLEQFKEQVERCIGLLSTELWLERLSSSDLLCFLNTCISGQLQPISIPPDGCFIDTILGAHSVLGGYHPKIDDNFVQILSIVGYLNQETIPGLLEELTAYPLVYRWSNRFIALSESTAEREIKRYQKNWNNKVKGFMGIVREVIFSQPTRKFSHDALQMVDETNTALTINSNRSVRFGYWTSEIVLIHDDESVMKVALKEIQRYLEQAGFKCIKEDVNALDAWLGTIPGHGFANVRRCFIDSKNLSHVLPLNSIWAGDLFSSSSSLLPLKSPPVFYAATTGKTPFRFHMDVSDVGHQIIMGPTGSGKSTYLGFLITQFLRYKDAQVFVFDKDYSHQALTVALSGHHYDIGNADKLSFCPLADLSTESKKVRAGQFIESLVTLQNITITPEIRSSIYDALRLLFESNQSQSRNITVFRSTVQNDLVRQALKYYTVEGQISLLDATEDGMQTGYLQTFEMGWLLSQRAEIYVPILMYIFDQIESRLEESNGKKPTMIVLEEAWLYVSHPLFANKLRDWLKTLRKKNARVVFATQSLSDLYDPTTHTLTQVTAAILESCPTKIYLPNPKMESETKGLYKKMGLNDRQIDIIGQISIPKRHYYVVTHQGNRLIELGFSDEMPMAFCFIGLSKEKSKMLMDMINLERCIKEEWVYEWMNENGFSEWADYWLKHYKPGVLE